MRTKVGISSPLIATEEGWLMLYHGVRHTESGSICRLGVAIFDLAQPERLLLRAHPRNSSMATRPWAVRLEDTMNETTSSATAGGVHYGVMGFLLLTPLAGIIGTAAYTYAHGFHWWMLVLALGMYTLVGISICAGYHRFFSHKSYEASRPLQIFYALFGAMAAQNSILWWSSSHRVHHQYVDREWDPYNIRRGFWWAHIVWIFYRHPAPDVDLNAPDLLQNGVVRWQNRWYHLILIVGGFGVPAAIGLIFGDAIAGLLWGGFLRLVVIHHTTFFVNSLAHYVGKPTYNAAVSARDNWCVALLTLGEGYHSFHHRFPADYRNGVRWYQWDPAKWFIATMRFAGLARGLRATPRDRIEAARGGPAPAGSR